MSMNNLTANLTAWDLLLAGLKTNQDDLPHLGSYLTQLEGVVAALRALQITRAALAEESQQGTLNLYAGLAQAKDLATRLRDSVLGHYGHRSDKLTEFGLKPAGKRRKQNGAHRNPTAP